MAAITAKDVAALRAKTGIGMMECKKALVEAEGDMEKALKVLRERGLAVAAKKEGRIAADGISSAGDVRAARASLCVCACTADMSALPRREARNAPPCARSGAGMRRSSKMPAVSTNASAALMTP